MTLTRPKRPCSFRPTAQQDLSPDVARPPTGPHSRLSLSLPKLVPGRHADQPCVGFAHTRPLPPRLDDESTDIEASGPERDSQVSPNCVAVLAISRSLRGFGETWITAHRAGS